MWDIGTKIKIDGWPAGGEVIGHRDGQPIIQPNPCLISEETIFVGDNEELIIRLIPSGFSWSDNFPAIDNLR